MEEAHKGLIEIIKLIEEYYGEEKVSPNLHLSLHLCEYSYDYGSYTHSGVFHSNEWMAYLVKMNFLSIIFLFTIIHDSFLFC